MASTLNSDLLAGMIKEKRGQKSLRDASIEITNEIGKVSTATLSRIEQGKVPDVETFIKLCKWLDAPTDTFIINQTSTETSNQERIVAHLRADRVLDQSTVQALLKMINLAYGK